ncbi:MAG: hypothetical protein E2O40_00895 [Planctomycetota bacterium]|nr:MAG: hypothetical protein E2O40_00895 [Planctomycetota bacterium]
MGHVEAETEDRAYDILGDNNIVVEGLAPDPERTDDSRQPGLASAIDDALAASSHRVPFDSLQRRFAGKRVWVIDRDKIKKRVLQTVDEVIHQSREQAEDDTSTADRLTEALERLFGDNRNLTSPVSTGQEALEVQLNRLADVVRQLEHAAGAMQTASRWAGGGYGGGRSFGGAHLQRPSSPENDEVLREIFQTNLDLHRRLRADADKGARMQRNRKGKS